MNTVMLRVGLDASCTWRGSWIKSRSWSGSKSGCQNWSWCGSLTNLSFAKSSFNTKTRHYRSLAMAESWTSSKSRPSRPRVRSKSLSRSSLEL